MLTNATFNNFPVVPMPYLDALDSAAIWQRPFPAIVWMQEHNLPVPAPRRVTTTIRQCRRPFLARCYQSPYIPKINVVESKPRPKPPVVAPIPRPKPKPIRFPAARWLLVRMLAIPCFVEDAIRHHSLTPWPQ